MHKKNLYVIIKIVVKTNAERRDFDAESDHQADAPFDAQGNVAEPGYCVHNLYDYVRSDIKANPLRIKEWDFYQITDERYTMQMTIGTPFLWRHERRDAF